MVAESFTKSIVEEGSPPAQARVPTPKHRFEDHEYSVSSFVFLHDNVHIVTGSLDGTMRKRNYETGLVVGEPWKGDGGSIYSLALSPDGDTIACGRADGSLQRWTTDGKMTRSAWRGHSSGVRSLSWSPSGSCIASGSYDGTILIRNGKSGEVEVGPIKTQQEWVLDLAYSPSGDRIASGGYNEAICIWDSKTGELVGPISDPTKWSFVTSLVWSSDSSKLYSVSDNFARVLDGTSGKLLHRFEHDNLLYSIALSPGNNVLACVDYGGIVRLWDTESHQPFGEPFGQDHETLRCVSFSRDGRYLAYGGYDRKLTLWMVEDIDPQLAVQKQGTHQDTQPGSPASSCLDADATNQLGSDGITEDVYDDPYDNFFQSMQPTLPSTSSGTHLPHQSPARRLWSIISQHRPLGHKVRTGEEDKKGEKDVDCSVNAQPGASKREEYSADAQTPPPDDSVPPAGNHTEENRNPWKWPIRARNNSAFPKMDPATTEVVEVYAARGFQRYVAFTRKKKTKSLAAMSGAPLAAPHVTGLSQVAPQGSSAQPDMSLQPMSEQPGPLSYIMVRDEAQYLPATGGLSPQESPSHFVTAYHTIHNSDSRSSIEGSCNRFLDKICFPCGHYHED
ncbi:WD40-repeat-containing domain protein [Suillus paluster]|uniref:WD40-repeat-containing domain protein n=1 Tax=Suillus paluster TaxID=48578 RepID=UPI001B861576|nr:WD40-repeat-containing domain protein [Suillus paluster]KAG1728481.1 WD40-repeat-containing domain protein [Suillus paluster]